MSSVMWTTDINISAGVWRSTRLRKQSLANRTLPFQLNQHLPSHTSITEIRPKHKNFIYSS